MIYGDKLIREIIFSMGFIEGAELTQINPASVNVRLGNTFLIPAPEDGKIHLGEIVNYDRYEVKDTGSMGINPGEFMLATTKEKITMPPNVAAFVQGRSSIGRIALTVQNAGFIDPGFSGHITLELVNETDYLIELPPGYPVAQIVFFDVSEVEHPYRGKYNGQVEATGSRMFMDQFNQ